MGIALAIAQHLLPPKWSRLLPSAPALGLAFVIPAWNSISLFIGALAGYVLTQISASWSQRFLIAAAAGLVAGESLAGVASAMGRMFFQPQ